MKKTTSQPRPPIEALREKYVGKRVVDKYGIHATVTDIRELTNTRGTRTTPVQVTLNGEVRMAWQGFFTVRRFTIVKD